jgi:UDP-N-acetyl-D-mannosaminuronate dehydrogenase
MNKHMNIQEKIKNGSVVVVATKHAVYDFEMIRKYAKMIIDLQNAYNKSDENLYKL